MVGISGEGDAEIDGEGELTVAKMRELPAGLEGLQFRSRGGCGNNSEETNS